MGTGSSGTHWSQKMRVSIQGVLDNDYWPVPAPPECLQMRYFKHKMMLKWVPECLSPAFLKSAKQILFIKGYKLIWNYCGIYN